MIRSVLALALLAAAPAHAQFGAMSQDARGVPPSPVRAAQGDAYAASPLRETALFGNPAHLAFLGGRLPKVQVGATVGAGGNVREAWRFWDETLGPAVDAGLDALRQEDIDRLEEIYDETLRIGATQKTATAAAEVSGTFHAGGLGIGLGVATTATARARVFNGGAGIPYADTYAQADLLVPVAIAVSRSAAQAGMDDLPGAPSAVGLGVQLTTVHRQVTAKAGAIDSFDPDGENVYVLSGTGVGVDLGLHAADVGVPGLDLGVVWHNAVGGAPDLTYRRAYALWGEPAADAAEAAALEARFAERGRGSAVRGGIAYRVPVPAAPVAARILLDVTSASTAEFEQSMQAGLRLGAEVTVARMLELRAGASQGLPSAGVGLALPGVRVDYATHGVEDGALIGQQPRRAHLLQVRFGIH